MKNNVLKNSFKIGAVYTGAIIGAGFASGQEIESFFLKYGSNSFLGLFLMGILFSVIGAKILNRIRKKEVSCFKDYFSPYLSAGVCTVLEYITIFFMVSVFCVMVAGSGALFAECLHIDPLWGVLIMQILCFFVFLNGAKGLVALNTVLIPVMFVGILVLSIWGIVFKTTPSFFSLPSVTNNWVFSSLLYVSYNVLTLISVMLPLRQYLKDKKTAICGGLFGGVVLTVMALVIWICLYLFGAEVANLEIPFLYVAQKGGWFYEGLYFVILFLAMYTTATANGFAILDRFKSHRIRNALFLCVLSFPLSLLGFSTLVEHLYTFFGYLGLGITVLVLIL